MAKEGSSDGRRNDRARSRGRRGGRGRNNSRGIDRLKPKATENQSKKMFFPHGGKMQTATYDAVKEQILLDIQKTFDHGDDIVESLREEQEIDFTDLTPSKAISTKTDKADKEAQQEIFDALYVQKLKLFCGTGIQVSRKQEQGMRGNMELLQQQHSA